MEKILPIILPPVTTYQYIALPLTVAMNNITAENWFYSDYIQVLSVKHKKYIEQGHKENALHYCFWRPNIVSSEAIDFVEIKRNSRNCFSWEIGDIIEAVNNGWYIYMFADVYYINGHHSFGIDHYIHDLLIYGYDNENVLVYMYGEKKLGKHSVPYINFSNGMYSEECMSECMKSSIFMIKPSDKTFYVEVRKIKRLIEEYLGGHVTFGEENKNTKEIPYAYGIKTYKEFNDWFCYIYDTGLQSIRVTDLYCLFEHKQVMLNRVRFLNQRNLMKINSELETSFNEIYILSKRLMLLGMKYNFLPEDNKKYEIMFKMKQYLEIMKNKEDEALNKYISENKLIFT